MGVSFKVSRTGSRYRPRPPPSDDADDHDAVPEPPLPAPKGRDSEAALLGSGDRTSDCKVSSVDCENNHVGTGLRDGTSDCRVSSVDRENNHVGTEHEASFCLKLFPDGFSIAKPNEGMPLPSLEDMPKLLHPYDRTSKTLFSAIEHGWIPGDILDDIPSEFFNGSLICEVLDYRSSVSKFGNNDFLGDDFPKVQKVRLRMGMETVIKDLALISDDSWTYNDLLQAEAQILKALQPVLVLGTKPSLDRLCATVPKQLDLGTYERRQRRKQQHIPEVNSNSIDLSHGRDISNNGAVDKQKYQRDGAVHCVQSAISRSNPCDKRNHIGKDVAEHGFSIAFPPNYSSKVGSLFTVPSNGRTTSEFLSLAEKGFRSSCIGLNLPEKRNRNKSEPTPAFSLKKPKQEPLDFAFGPSAMFQRETLLDQERQLQKQQEAQNIQHQRLADQNSHRLGTTGVVIERFPDLASQMTCQLYQQGMKRTTENKILPKLDVGKKNDENALNSRCEKFNKLHHLSNTKAFPPQLQGTSTDLSTEKFPEKGNASRKRKLPLGSQVVAGGSDHHSAAQLGVNQRTSAGAPCSKCPTIAEAGLQKNKDALMPVASAGITFPSSSPSNSIYQENHISDTNARPKSHEKVSHQSMAGTESPAVSSDTNSMFRLKRLSFGSSCMQPPLDVIDDQAITERFSKIKMVAERNGLNNKKNRSDMNFMSKPLSNYAVSPIHLFISEGNDGCQPLTETNLIDETRDFCKSRILTFLRRRHAFRGQPAPSLFIELMKLVLFESNRVEKDGVEIYLVYRNDGPLVYFTTFPTPHRADLFAAQFTSLMEHDGYRLADDQLQTTPGNNFDPSDATSIHILQGDTEPCIKQDIPSQVPSIGTPIANYKSTFSPHRVPPQKIPSPSRTPNFISQPQQLETVLSVQQKNYQNQNSLSPNWRNSVGNASMKLGNEMPSDIACSQNPYMLPSQRMLYQQPAIVQGNMANLGPRIKGLGLSEHVSRLNMSRVNDHQPQDSNFSNSCSQFLNGGLLDAFGAQVGRPAKRPGMILIDDMPIKILTESVVDTVQNRPVPAEIVGTSCSSQLHDIDRVLTGLPNIPSMNFATDNYNQRQQQQIQSLQQPEQLSSTQQHSPPLTTQISHTSSMGQSKLPLGSLPQQVNAGDPNISSPQLNSQTVGSCDIIMSSPMDFPGINK